MSRETTFIATTPLEGVRPLAYQGVQAITAHAQLSRLLEDRLSKEHAAFLAEPLTDPLQSTADWYTPAQGPVRRLSELSPEERPAVLSRISSFAAAMQTLADELRQSADSNAKMAGSLLELALSYPSEDFLYVVGDQPVLVCWGCGSANAAAAPEPLTRLAAVAPVIVPPPKPAPETPEMVYDTRKRGGFPWWLLFFLLGFLVCLFLLPWIGPRLGLPAFTLDFFPTGCAPVEEPAARPAVPAPSDEYNFSQDKEKALRSELERLQRDYAARLAACPPKEARVDPEPEQKPDPEPQVAALPPPQEKPEPPPLPDPPPKREQPQTLQIPKDSRDLSILEGCWLAGKGLLKNVRTGLPVAVKYCFDKNGRGDSLIQEFDKNGRMTRQCKGTATARMQNGRLVIDDNGSIVCPDGARYNHTQSACVDKGGEAICSRTNPPHNWKDVPFTRTTR